IKYAHPDLQKDQEVLTKVLDSAPWERVKHLLPHEIITDKNLMLKALRCISPEIITDKKRILKALEVSWEAIKYAHPDLQKDQEILTKVLDSAPWEKVKHLLPHGIITDKECALKALNRSWEAVKYISTDVFCKDVEVLNKVLDEAPWEVIRDLLFSRVIPGGKNSALKALNRSWEAVKYIRNQVLLSNEEFALEAIKIHPLVLPYISKNLISDDRFLHSVVVQKPLAKTSSGEMAIASMINLNGLHLAPPLLSCPKDVQCNLRDFLTEFDKNIIDKSIYRDAGNLQQLYSQRDDLENLCNKVQNTSNDLLFIQLSLLLKNIIYQWKTGKGLEKKDQNLRALADAASKCTPTWLEVATRIYSELDGSGTPEAELLTLVQKYKEETILQFTQVNARHWHSLNYIRKRYGTDLGLNTTLARHDMYTDNFPSSLTKWQIKALWDACSLLESVHTALSTQEYSIPLYDFLKQITEKNHLAKDKDSIVGYVSDNFYNEDYTLNLHAVHVMLIDIGVLEKVV
ncbi:MAG: DUF4116 domain-containing protein, partial [Candidatus Rhabdochlamydia oedothoracis]|nr:DUF4116 domain-containing protein [Candidatus Rhabdochlamydia oedothoracis]